MRGTKPRVHLVHYNFRPLDCEEGDEQIARELEPEGNDENKEQGGGNDENKEDDKNDGGDNNN